MNPIIPDCTIPGKEWETVVQNKKQEVLNERSKNLPPRKNDPVSVQHPDEVKIVDKSYLNKNFKADGVKDQQFIDTTVKDFMLNIEQERAFRIIANHATSKHPEQLKMYLGGMAGTGKS